MTRRASDAEPASQEPTPGAEPAETPAAPVHDEDLVVLYPTGRAMVPGIPTDVIVCTPEDAAELLAYHPPIFTTDEPVDLIHEPECNERCEPETGTHYLEGEEAPSPAS